MVELRVPKRGSTQSQWDRCEAQLGLGGARSDEKRGETARGVDQVGLDGSRDAAAAGAAARGEAYDEREDGGDLRRGAVDKPQHDLDASAIANLLDDVVEAKRQDTEHREVGGVGKGGERDLADVPAPVEGEQRRGPEPRRAGELGTSDGRLEVPPQAVPCSARVGQREDSVEREPGYRAVERLRGPAGEPGVEEICEGRRGGHTHTIAPGAPVAPQ